MGSLGNAASSFSSLGCPCPDQYLETCGEGLGTELLAPARCPSFLLQHSWVFMDSSDLVWVCSGSALAPLVFDRSLKCSGWVWRDLSGPWPCAFSIFPFFPFSPLLSFIFPHTSPLFFALPPFHPLPFFPLPSFFLLLLSTPLSPFFPFPLFSFPFFYFPLFFPPFHLCFFPFTLVFPALVSSPFPPGSFTFPSSFFLFFPFFLSSPFPPFLFFPFALASPLPLFRFLPPFPVFPFFFLYCPFIPPLPFLFSFPPLYSQDEPMSATPPSHPRCIPARSLIHVCSGAR